MTAEQEMRALWATAEARRKAGESIRDQTGNRTGPRAWLDNFENMRFHECWIRVQDEEADLAAQAVARLKHRRAGA